jgi:hypothetical protein
MFYRINHKFIAHFSRLSQLRVSTQIRYSPISTLTHLKALDIIVYHHLPRNYCLSTIVNKISILYLSEVYYSIVYNIFSYFLVIFF